VRQSLSRAIVVPQADGWSVIEPLSSVYSRHCQLAGLRSGSHICSTFVALRDECAKNCVSPFRIAKLLRQSFRRSVRRLANALGDSSTLPPPPDYSAVLVEMNRTPQDHSEQLPEPSSAHLARMSTMTAADVAHILRSSLRHSAPRNRDIEGLVGRAAPIHHDVMVPPIRPELDSKTEAESTSVIWIIWHHCWSNIRPSCSHCIEYFCQYLLTWYVSAQQYITWAFFVTSIFRTKNVNKVRLSLCLIQHHVMKTWGHRAPYILNISVSKKWVVSCMPWLLYPQGERSLYWLDRRLGGWASEPVCLLGQKYPLRELNIGHPAHLPVRCNKCSYFLYQIKCCILIVFIRKIQSE
jgi:hypothetical protein